MDSLQVSAAISISISGFPYAPLDLSRNEIRLISFPRDAPSGSPPAHDGLVRCVMETVSLDDKTSEYERFRVRARPATRREMYESWRSFAGEGGSLSLSVSASATGRARRRSDVIYYRFKWGDYGALSYTWGDQTNKVPIILNGSVVKVGRNLETALRALSLSPDYAGGLKLWVDALCIDQQDLTDRNSQVKRMGTIFGDALLVTIWLGDVLPEQRPGLELIHSHIIESTDARAAAETIDRLFRDDGEKEARMKLATEAMNTLVQAPYWSRVWVIQEKCLGSFNPDVLFGHVHFPLLSLRNLLARADNVRLAVTARSSVWRMLRLVDLVLLVQQQRRRQLGQGETEEERSSDVEMLTLLLMLGRLGGCVNARDKLYGLMGMMPAYIAQHIEPDYSKSVEHVFCDFARALVAGLGHFNFLLTGLSSTGLNIPSWVPDLTDPWDPALWGTGCMAAGGRGPRYRIEDGGARLVAKGFQVDVVDGTAPHLGWGNGELEVWRPAEQPSSAAAAAAIPNDPKTAIVRTLHRDADWDCTTGTTILDIPWIKAAPNDSTPRTEAMRRLGWGPVLQQANLADLVKLCNQLNDTFQPWGKPFSSFFGYVDLDDNDALPECRDPEAFVRSLNKHIGVVYPVITTAAGRFGTAIRPVLPGDLIFCILGCDGLVVLRPVDADRADGAYHVISQCYVEGLMKGEGIGMLDRGETELQDVVLV
ncbi:heterokaryon incompatibility protein [Stachybotrys elegans]|uniref:Heterokaryon incompatibility protein n=1 Tax=Stachybotrys elegans TaxID=80388 RepID=A0A8K0SPR8_9HYPO|nr:heterokaryon incompatibility protein [Stachybotrys elegans]